MGWEFEKLNKHKGSKVLRAMQTGRKRVRVLITESFLVVSVRVLGNTVVLLMENFWTEVPEGQIPVGLGAESATFFHAVM